MTDSSSVLASACRAVRGEFDQDTVRAATSDDRLSTVLALAPGVHAVVRIIAILRNGFTALLDPQMIADPVVHAAMQRLIGMTEGRLALSSWAGAARAGWHADDAEALLSAVRCGQCAPGSAAALIGPCNESAHVLRVPSDIAFAISRWGHAYPDDPTWWTSHIAAATRDRLCAEVWRDREQGASCLPWLPSDAIRKVALPQRAIPVALSAFAAASPAARALHAALVRRIVARARPEHVGALTRLAHASGMEVIWKRICTLLQESPDCAGRIVAAVWWDDAPDEVRATMLDRAACSQVCAAIAAARGRRRIPRITDESAVAFFAALDPDVWDTLDAAMQRQLTGFVLSDHAHLVIRSLGLRPELLVHARLDNNLVGAALRHVRNLSALHDALLPVAVRALAFADAYALVAALPEMPRDPGAFFCVASGIDDPAALLAARDALHTLDDLALAIALRRSADADGRIQDACMTISRMLRGRTSNASVPVRACLLPDVHTLADSLARPECRDQMHHAFDRLLALPPEIAVPALVAWERWRRFAVQDRTTSSHGIPGHALLEQWRTKIAKAQDMLAGLVAILRDHGSVFVDIVDALADAHLRSILLPLPDDPLLADALCRLTRNDLPNGLKLARALAGVCRHERFCACLPMIHDVLRQAPVADASAVLAAMRAARQGRVVADLDARLAAIAADGCAGRIHHVWQRLARTDPAAAFALAVLAAQAASHPDELLPGADMLAAHPAMTRTILPLLHPAIRSVLHAHPALAALLADLSDPAPALFSPRMVRRSVYRPT